MSKVTYENFLVEFAKDLEIHDEKYRSCLLSEIPQFDSMGVITLSLTIERLFGFQIDYESLETQETAQSLYDYCIGKATG
jgi:acyl carrier protein